MNHPNRIPFIGILGVVDSPSDRPPSGARGHRVKLTSYAASNALPSLIGMGLNISPDGTKHCDTSKVGVIEKAEIRGDEIIVSGHIWGFNFPAVIAQLNASAEYGMSYEMADVHVEDMRADVWELKRVTFTGAAIILRDKTAYKRTDFTLADGKAVS